MGECHRGRRGTSTVTAGGPCRTHSRALTGTAQGDCQRGVSSVPDHYYGRCGSGAEAGSAPGQVADAAAAGERRPGPREVGRFWPADCGASSWITVAAPRRRVD